MKNRLLIALTLGAVLAISAGSMLGMSETIEQKVYKDLEKLSKNPTAANVAKMEKELNKVRNAIKSGKMGDRQKKSATRKVAQWTAKIDELKAEERFNALLDQYNKTAWHADTKVFADLAKKMTEAYSILLARGGDLSALEKRWQDAHNAKMAEYKKNDAIRQAAINALKDAGDRYLSNLEDEVRTGKFVQTDEAAKKLEKVMRENIQKLRDIALNADADHAMAEVQALIKDRNGAKSANQNERMNLLKMAQQSKLNAILDDALQAEQKQQKDAIEARMKEAREAGKRAAEERKKAAGEPVPPAPEGEEEEGVEGKGAAEDKAAADAQKAADARKKAEDARKKAEEDLTAELQRRGKAAGEVPLPAGELPEEEEQEEKEGAEAKQLKASLERQAQAAFKKAGVRMTDAQMNTITQKFDALNKDGEEGDIKLAIHNLEAYVVGTLTLDQLSYDSEDVSNQINGGRDSTLAELIQGMLKPAAGGEEKKKAAEEVKPAVPPAPQPAGAEEKPAAGSSKKDAMANLNTAVDAALTKYRELKLAEYEKAGKADLRQAITDAANAATVADINAVIAYINGTIVPAADEEAGNDAFMGLGDVNAVGAAVSRYIIPA